MKRLLMLIGLTGAMATAGAIPAKAINKEWSAALGFLGGVLVERSFEVSRAFDPGCDRGRYDYHGRYDHYRSPPPCRTTVYAPPPPMIVQQPIVVQPSGHYEIRETQEWVPGTWRYDQIDCNTYRKVWCPGYYRTIQTRVWVQDCP